MGNLFVFHMAGIAALTLLVNASTTGLLVEKLGVANVSVASKQIFHNAVRGPGCMCIVAAHVVLPSHPR